MVLQASCPKCGKKYKAPEKLAGRSVRCKACQRAFTITVPTADEGPLDLAPEPALSSGPRVTARLAASLVPMPFPETPVSKPLYFRILLAALGPIDRSLWAFLPFMIPWVALAFVPGSHTLFSCITLFAAFILFLVGAIWAVRVLLENGISITEAILVILFPVASMILFYRDMFARWEIYKAPLFCQLRGAALVFMVIIAADIDRSRTDAAFQRQLDERMEQARRSQSQPDPARSQPGLDRTIKE